MLPRARTEIEAARARVLDTLRAPATHVQVETWHVAALCLVLLAVHCCQHLVAACRECDAACATLFADCCDPRSCSAGLRRAVLLACFMQPFVLCIALAFRGDGRSSTTVLVDNTRLWCATKPDSNTSDVARINARCAGSGWNNATGADALADALVRVDALFFLMPYAVAASVSTLLWTHLGHENVLHEGVSWDADLDPACLWYELAYCAELFTAALAYVGLLADGATPLELYYAALAAGGALAFAAGAARAAREPETEAVFALLVVGLFFIVFSNIFTHVITVQCTLALLVALVFALHVSVVAFAHISARGERLASTIIAVRTLSSLAGGYALIAAYALGKDQACVFE